MVVGTCTQQTLKNATLYLGNTAEAGLDAIEASAGSSWTTTTRMTMPMRESTSEMSLIFADLESRMPPNKITGAKVPEAIRFGSGGKR